MHEEVDEVLGDADDLTTLKLMPNLKYLERVIKEALRLYPSAPAISRQLTEDLKMGKTSFYEKCNLKIGNVVKI